MQTYLERIQEIYNKTPMKRLQDYWKRAESISAGDGEKAEAIFSNMLSLSEEAPNWWASMSKKKKRHFLGKKKQPVRQEKLIAIPEPETEEKPDGVPHVDDDKSVEDAQVVTPEEAATEVETKAVEPEEGNAKTSAEVSPPASNEVANTEEESAQPSEVSTEVSEEKPEGTDSPEVDEPDSEEAAEKDEPDQEDTPAEDEPEPNDESSNEPEPDWWHKLSKDEKKEYLDEHPRSKFALTPGDGEEEEPPPSWWLKLTTDEQKDYLKKNPDKTDLKVLADDPVSIKSAVASAWHKSRAKSSATISQHKKGLHALKTLFSGGGLNREDREQAKKTAILGTKLVLGALAGIALFAAFGPSVAILGKLFLNDQGMASESSADANDPNIDPTMGDDKFSVELLDKIHEWLTTQDIADLTKRIEEEKASQLPS